MHTHIHEYLVLSTSEHETNNFKNKMKKITAASCLNALKWLDKQLIESHYYKSQKYQLKNKPQKSEVNY